MSNDNQNNGNVVGKVIAGAAVVGAGIAAAKILSDKDNREKIGDAVNNVKGKVEDKLEELKTSTLPQLEERFNTLRAEIESSPQASMLSQHINSLAERIMELRDSGSEDMRELVERVKTEIDEMQKEFGANK